MLELDEKFGVIGASTGSFVTTLFCPICVGYRVELHVSIYIFIERIFFYQLNKIIFFGVDTNYLCFLGNEWYS